MRRLGGIPVRKAVAVTLPLVGAIYMAAEARQAVIRRYSMENSLSTVNAPQPISLAKSDNLYISGFTAGLERSPERMIAPVSALAAPSASKAPAVQSPGQDELLAEQQAAQLPPQNAPKQPARDAHRRKVIISIPDRRLALLEDDQLVTTYPIAVGASETPSPSGEFTIINHAVNPTYRHEDKEIAPGKDNPLGTRWMGLSLKGYGIHGTNVQDSVGKAASHGCFRMKKKDVEELYSRLQVGDAVSVRTERDELSARLFAAEGNATAAVNKPEVQIAPMTTPAIASSEDR